MLPSTKLFKEIDCPFYQDNSESCTRPYCHYNHTKADNRIHPVNAVTDAVEQAQNVQILNPPGPIYIPTPKYILEARKTNYAPVSESSTSNKKPKLEYVPKSKAPADASYPTPTYIPSAISPSADSEHSVFKENDTHGLESTLDDISGLATELSVDPAILKDKESTAAQKSPDNRNEKKLEKKESSSSSSKHRRHSSNSKSSSSRSHSSRSDRKSESEKSSSSSRKHSSAKESSSSKSHHKSSSSSGHKSSHHSSSKSKYSEKSKGEDSQRNKDRTSKRSSSKDDKEKNGERRKSTSSSSSHRHTSSHKDKKNSNSSKNKKDRNDDNHKVASTSTITTKDCIENSYLFDSDSEEDDIEQQCRMIFEEFDPSTVNKNDSCPGTRSRSPSQEESDDPMAKYDYVNKRRRLAYENADKQLKPLATFNKGVNHVQNAMQLVFMRQEITRKQNEAKQEKEAVQLEEKRKSLELEQTLSKNDVTLKPPLKLTPLVPIAALTPHRMGPRTFTSISNTLAIQRAKEKVEQLKAAKLQQLNQSIPKTTIAQTTVKGTGRIAHTNAVPPKDTKLAPPVLEATSTKISHNIRMQYYNLMVKHCLTIYDECSDAWERAQTEELAVFKKCSTAVIYKSSALVAINKLRKESLDAGNVNTEKNKAISHDVILAGKLGQQTSWSINKKLKTDASGSNNIVDTVSSTKAYEMIVELCLTDEQLKENGYPRCGGKPGVANIFKGQSATPNNENDRYCRRCGKIFRLDEYDEECVDRCIYHPKSPGFRRGFADNAHRCCQQPAGSPGCMYANYHVTDHLDYNNLTGFIKTIAYDDEYEPSRKDVFALDCEMCYTTVGLELTRVTVVDINRKTVYDELVKPDNRIIDYNTTYSGISEKTLQNVTRTLRDVQAVLLSIFNSKTILIGHSLESDFKALKLIHDVVVDTSILYPHKMGPPKKRALKTLCIEHLKRIIQEDEAGHNSAEDAEVCIDLVKHYLRNRIK